MTVRWEELTEKRVTLVALSQSPVLTLTVAMAARLEVLGLAQPGSLPMRRFAKPSSGARSES